MAATDYNQRKYDLGKLMLSLLYSKSLDIKLMPSLY